MRTKTWPKVREKPIKVKGRAYLYWEVDAGLVNGKRYKRNFKTKREAEAEAGRLRTERDEIGNDALELTPEQKKDAVRALGSLEPGASLSQASEFYGQIPSDQRAPALRALSLLRGRVTLEQAVDFYVLHAPASTVQKTVDEVFQEFLQSKQDANRRPATIRDAKYKAGNFVKSFKKENIQRVSTRMIESWLAAKKFTPANREVYIRHIRGLFEYAVRRQYLVDNPAAPIEKPKLDESLPEIMAAGDVEKIMRAAETHYPEMVSYFAIGFFAGLRPAEIQGIDWKDIDIEARLIRVVPEVAKKRRQRYVDISDNLMAWLDVRHLGTGPVFWTRTRVQAVRKKAGVVWAHDVMRHTFASCHLAHHEDAARTSLQMGHMHPSVLFNNYRNLVRRDEAQKFWSITPQPVSAGMTGPHRESQGP